MENSLTVKAEPLGCGEFIGVAFEYRGKRTAVRVDNPFWPEIDADWHRAHPDAPRFSGCIADG